MSVCKLVLRAIFKAEKICSTLPFENGKLNANLLRLITMGHLEASGQDCNLFQTFRYRELLMSMYFRA